MNILARSDSMRPGDFDDGFGGLPENVAFLAMTLHQLGRTDEAELALARLRFLMQRPKHSNDEESQAFLREAEALIVGESDAEAETGGDTQP